MFDHPGRTFSSVAHAWENCQRDTSDVKVSLSLSLSLSFVWRKTKSQTNKANELFC